MKWVIAILIAAFIIYWIFAERSKQLSLKSERKNWSPDMFADFFEKEGIPRSFSVEIYKYLQGLLGVKEVPIAPADDLQEVLGIGLASGILLNEVVEDALSLVDVTFPFQQHMEIFAQDHGWAGKVDDLVRLLYFLKCESDGIGP